MRSSSLTVFIALWFALSPLALANNVDKLVNACGQNNSQACEELKAIAVGPKGEALIEKLVTRLSRWNPQPDRQKAAQVLITIGAPAVASLYAHLLSSDYYGPGVGSKDPYDPANVLAKIGAPAVDFLMAELRTTWSSSGTWSWDVEKELIKIGPSAVEPLIAALNDPNDGVRSSAARALGKIKDPRGVEPLIAALGDRDEQVGDEAARALGEIKDSRSVQPLIAALNDPSLYLDVRRTVATALSGFNDPRAVAALELQERADQIALAKAATESTDARTRAAAVWNLSDQILLTKIAREDKDAHVREMAEVSLAALQTANLAFADRVRANWPRLRQGMSYDVVRRLVGPFPQNAETAAGAAAFASVMSSPVATSMSVTTDVYTLRFENLSLTYWMLNSVEAGLKANDNVTISSDVAFVLDGIKAAQSRFYYPSSMQVRFAYIEDAGEKRFGTLADGPVACFELIGQNQYGGKAFQRYSYYRTLDTKHPEREKLKFNSASVSSSRDSFWPLPCVSVFSNKLHPGRDVTSAVIQALQNAR